MSAFGRSPQPSGGPFGGSPQPSGGLFGAGTSYSAFGQPASAPPTLHHPCSSYRCCCPPIHDQSSAGRAQKPPQASLTPSPVSKSYSQVSHLVPPPPPLPLPPLPFPHPNHELNVPSGRGAGSPEVFQQIIKTNWHGRLGRTHMVDVDALPPTALMELDNFLRRKLQWIFPHGVNHVEVDADGIFACLAVLGLRLENRAQFVDFKVAGDRTICHDSTLKRARHLSAYYIGNQLFENVGYWRGLVLETLVELARYRGLFTEEGFLKLE